MTPITKKTLTLTTLAALVAVGAHAGVREADPVRSLDERLTETRHEAVKATYRYAERKALKAAYDKYREGIRISNIEDFTAYVRQDDSLPVALGQARKVGDHNWERQYEQLESEARTAAKNAVREALQKGFEVAQKKARAEAEKVVGQVPFQQIRDRMAEFGRKLKADLKNVEAARKIVLEAAERARQKRIEEVTRQLLAVRLAEAQAEAIEAGFEQYAAAEDKAYRAGKWYFNQEVPSKAPSKTPSKAPSKAPEVEVEVEPAASEDTSTTAPAIGHSGLAAPVTGTTYADTRNALVNFGGSLMDLFWSGVETAKTASEAAGHTAGLIIRGGAEIPKPVAEQVLRTKAEVAEQGGVLNWAKNSLFGIPTAD